MRESRSGSQILFGHLPDQTVDAAGGIWKVKRWKDCRIEHAIDAVALRQELLRAIFPWTENSNDSEMASDLLRQRPVVVKTLNREAGVQCDPFPRLYVCGNSGCKRLHDGPTGTCQCGSKARRGQLPFVGFHDKCGSIKTPFVRKCPVHGQRAVRLPGTASATEIIFYCPVCKDIIHRGFGAKCDCSDGGALSFTVHRSGRVFTPHGIVMINPPRREIVQQIDNAGGGERALEWVLDGMTARRITESQRTGGPDALRKVLKDQGYNDAMIETIVSAMPHDTVTTTDLSNVPTNILLDAQAEARNIALATFESRQTTSQLLEKSTNDSNRTLYGTRYPSSLARAGLQRVDLIDKFPVLTAQFGYTRGDNGPGVSRLRTYRDANGAYSLYGELIETEALFVQLKPQTVLAWLRRAGIAARDAVSDKDAMVAVLEVLEGPAVSNSELAGTPLELLTMLIHSYAHAFIKKVAVFSGIERSAISELVTPRTLGFFVYAAARGDFVLGGLQAVFESELDALIDLLVRDEHRCALDPGCSDNGAACAVCLHLGEPSCRMFNTHLSRNTLTGRLGYFTGP